MRALSGEAWARLQEGEAREAVELLLVARELAEAPQFSELDRADLLFRLGVCRYKLSSIATAVALFDEALAVASELRPSVRPAPGGHPRLALALPAPSARLRGRPRGRRGRARARAGTRATGASSANTYFQACLVAERMGQWATARTYAQQAGRCTRN